ncbi:MAG: T9SS C-terminal target domain-containing protein [Bacteroidetes bacterium]|nr:MAG: T9SS C-terminal target domain-containing protein [Bacteroidota bacterium]
MRKLYTTLALLFVAVGLSAQNVDVTFRVDMTGLTVAPVGVHIAGDFQSEAGLPGDWQPNTLKLDSLGGNLYAKTVSIPAGTYEYKFLNGNAWGTDETGITAECGNGGVGTLNRKVVITAAAVLPGYLFNTCTITFRSGIEQDLNSVRPVRFFPNPMSSQSVLEFSNDTRASYTFRMTTLNGQVVRELNVNSDAVIIERGDLAAGLYFVSLINEAGETFNQKVSLN